ncbi:hypothetical protein DAEQUDRAFT_749776 [Daedalea quercina L-15889]|uniref:Thioester reductase (TE) domain-containing protein n=1 Tax=Daedalea quercina L-15889 TaxID=1314783 RepID=A0A165SB55_9APHY|nr:hypothetical protein DAEQUDRAFT_749776 [Daedalea quercina L-15889]
MSRAAQGPLNTIALFGATGMLGSAFLETYVVVEGYKPKVLVFMRPSKVLNTRYEQHAQLRGTDALVSVLSGPGYASRYTLLDAAIKAGEDEKERFILHLKLHPHMVQPTEPFWCPWDQDVDTYNVPVAGDGGALADWSCRKDVARYVVATLAKPALSANAVLNFPSVTMSQNAMVELLRKYAGAKGHKVTVRYFSAEQAHRFVADASQAPQEIAKSSAIPADFYFVVKILQGSGYFKRPP